MYLKNQPIGNIPIMHNYEYADYDTMAAASFGSSDIGKVARVTGHSGIQFYLILSSTPKFGLISGNIISSVTTSSAAETALYTFATTTDFVYVIKAVVLASVDGGGNAAGYERIAAFKNDSGTVSIIGSTATPLTAEDNAAWDCQIEASGTNILIDVTGAAATTINWQGYIYIYALANGA